MQSVKEKTKKECNTKQPATFSWKENVVIQNLLNVIATTLAEEFIETAKQNPEVFSENGGSK